MAFFYTMIKFRLIIIILFVASIASSQVLEKNKKYFIAAIGFWNVENLYDTINDPLKNDEEFLPSGTNAWTGKRYWEKINHLAKVISEMGTDATPDGLAILGLCEIENKNVLQDLVKDPQLKARNYQYILMEGPDARGVDPALLYNPNYFKVQKVVTYAVHLPTDSSHKTRDQLAVSGFFGEEPMVIIVNHWPSRRGGELASRPNRNEAAKVAKHIADSVTKTNASAKIIIMGDLNDDPTNESVKKYLKTASDIHKVHEGEYFNPMEKLYKDGIGSLAWQDSWNLFDQTIINQQLLPRNYKTFEYFKAYVYNKAYLKSDFGNFKGYPFRTYSGGAYTAGYSDHFPVYLLIAKENAK